MSQENIIIAKVKEDVEIVDDDKEEVEIVEKSVDNFRSVINNTVFDLASYSMFDVTKRKPFAEELKKNDELVGYVDSQLYSKYFGSCQNPHIRAGVIYSYLYIKQLNSL